VLQCTVAEASLNQINDGDGVVRQVWTLADEQHNLFNALSVKR
jgi:hypothetical protein